MNDTVFIFGVLPGIACVVGAVLFACFATDILRWCATVLDVKRNGEMRSADPKAERQKTTTYAQPASSTKEMEFVHS